MIKLLIFDLDGTLVNAYPAVEQSVNFSLQKLGFPKKSFLAIKRAVGWGDRQLLAQFVGDNFADRAIKLYRPHHAKALATKSGVRFLPTAETTLRSLKSQGYKLAIASNRPTRFTRIILKNLKMDKLFDKVLCADKASRPKPYPDMLLAIIKGFHLSKKEAIYVGDMTIDVQTGHRAGVLTVAVATGSSSRKELKDLKPYQIIARISSIKKIITRRNHE